MNFVYGLSVNCERPTEAQLLKQLVVFFFEHSLLLFETIVGPRGQAWHAADLFPLPDPLVTSVGRLSAVVPLLQSKIKGYDKSFLNRHLSLPRKVEYLQRIQFQNYQQLAALFQCPSTGPVFSEEKLTVNCVSQIRAHLEVLRPSYTLGRMLHFLVPAGNAGEDVFDVSSVHRRDAHMDMRQVACTTFTLEFYPGKDVRNFAVRPVRACQNPAVLKMYGFLPTTKYEGQEGLASCLQFGAASAVELFKSTCESGI